jgi:hypothetical protein
MNTITCTVCSNTIEYSAVRPKFCSHCGSPLAEAKPGSTMDYDPQAATLAPAVDPEAATLAPSAATPSGPTCIERVGPYRPARLPGGHLHRARVVGEITGISRRRTRE